MSSITFNSLTRDVDLRGPERHHCGVLCSNLFNAALDISDFAKPEEVAPIIIPGHYVLRGGRVADAIATAVMVPDKPVFQLDGKPVDTLCAVLNTAIALGNRAIQLAARIHGQCEIHGFVEGPNRAWLADIIEEGLAAGIFRRHEMTDEQHRELAALLKSVRGAVALSGYHHPLYDELYGDCACVEKPTHADGARDRLEVLWLSPRALVQQKLLAVAQ